MLLGEQTVQVCMQSGQCVSMFSSFCGNESLMSTRLRWGSVVCAFSVCAQTAQSAIFARVCKLDLDAPTLSTVCTFTTNSKPLFSKLTVFLKKKSQSIVCRSVQSNRVPLCVLNNQIMAPFSAVSSFSFSRPDILLQTSRAILLLHGFVCLSLFLPVCHTEVNMIYGSAIWLKEHIW